MFLESVNKAGMDTFHLMDGSGSCYSGGTRVRLGLIVSFVCDVHGGVCVGVLLVRKGVIVLEECCFVQGVDGRRRIDVTDHLENLSPLTVCRSFIGRVGEIHPEEGFAASNSVSPVEFLLIGFVVSLFRLIGVVWGSYVLIGREDCWKVGRVFLE